MNKFKRFSVFIECSTCSTPTVDTVIRFIDVISKMGYNELYLGCTDAYKMEKYPYFNYMRGGYTTEDFMEMDSYAKEKGIELIANIQVLAHLHFLRRNHAFSHLFDTDHILMVGEEEVYELIREMFRTISKGLSSRRIHIGMDEAKGLGRGKYQEKHGVCDSKKLLLEHLNRVVKIADEFGYTTEIWADMLTYNDDSKSKMTTEEIKAMIPASCELVYWDYDTKDEEKLKSKISRFSALSDSNKGYAAAAWKISGFGPLNNHCIERIIPQMKISKDLGIEHFMITCWSDGGGQTSIFSILPALFAAAEYNKGETLDKNLFKEITGVDYDTLMLTDLINNPYNKDLDTRNNRSYWILTSDILIGECDLLLTKDEDLKYKELKECFESIPENPYSYIFEMSAALCDVLSKKVFLKTRLKEAYRNNDKAKLTEFLKVIIPELKKSLEKFNDIFTDYWLQDNIAYGLEGNQLYIGHQITRCNYLLKMLKLHLEKGTEIKELEDNTLPYSRRPTDTEDNVHLCDFKELTSRCGIN